MGSPLPPPEEMLQPLRALTPATECPLDGSYPLGTDQWVMVGKEAHDRSLLPHEAEAQHGEDARKFLEKLQARGLRVTAAWSDD